MYNEQIEQLVNAALADGKLTEKEKQILFKKAQATGIDLDEFEMILDARLVELQKQESEKIAKSAPKSNKLGDVKKCPNCGAIVQSYQGVCVECNYAFENIETNEAAKELSKLLQKCSNDNQMKQLIDTFPIPLDKGALLEFTSWVQPQSLDIASPLSNSYWRKYEECVNKMKMVFPDDKSLGPLIIKYEKDLKKRNKLKTISIIKTIVKNKFFWFGVGALIILIWWLWPASLREDPEKCTIAIEKAIKEDNLNEAKDLFLDFEDKYKLVNSGAAYSIFSAYLKLGDVINAEKIAKAGAADYDPDYPKEHAIAAELYRYYIDHGEYDKAKNIILTGQMAYHWTGTFIRDVVVDLCTKGKKAEAQRFLNINAAEINDNYDEIGLGSTGHQKYVRKVIQDIINTY